MSSLIRDLITDETTVALTFRQLLEPVEGRDVPIFPPTYPPPERGEHRFDIIEFCVEIHVWIISGVFSLCLLCFGFCAVFCVLFSLLSSSSLFSFQLSSDVDSWMLEPIKNSHVIASSSGDVP